MYDRIISITNLYESWTELIVDKVDKPVMTEFAFDLSEKIYLLHQDLVSKTYKHSRYEEFNVYDPKPRIIHNAEVRDKIIHRAIKRILYPDFDKRFIFDSYSSRDGKGHHLALDRFKNFSRKVSHNYTRTCWVLKCDIRKFFASIDHAILKNILAKHISDPDTLLLLDRVIDSFSTKDKFGVGLPLGNLTSQLFVNIYMNEFDQFVKHKLKVKCYIRYADDFVIMSHDRKYLEKVFIKTCEFLNSRLKLSTHPDKCSIKALTSGIDFLGWIHFPGYRILRTNTKRRMFKNLADSQPSESTINSYLGLLKHGKTKKIKKRLYTLGIPVLERM